MIEIENVSKTYKGNVKAVDNLTLNIERGSVYGFLGPNGAGKSTTINMITGIIQPDEGSIIINGFDMQKDDVDAKQHIGFVPDDPNAFLRLTGIEYLNFMADMYEVPQNKRLERIKNLSKRLEMDRAFCDKIQSYSHGMRQKIMIIGALIHEPMVWILDEPMSGLDPKSSYEIKNMMREYAQKGRSVFFSTHVLQVAETVCDKIAVINKGEIMFSGNLSDMKEHSNASLENIFLEMTENE